MAAPLLVFSLAVVFRAMMSTAVLITSFFRLTSCCVPSVRPQSFVRPFFLCVFSSDLSVPPPLRPATADADSFPGDQPGGGGYPEEKGKGPIDNRVRDRRLHYLHLALQGLDLRPWFCSVCLASLLFFFFFSLVLFPVPLCVVVCLNGDRIDGGRWVAFFSDVPTSCHGQLPR